MTNWTPQNKTDATTAFLVLCAGLTTRGYDNAQAGIILPAVADMFAKSLVKGEKTSGNLDYMPDPSDPSAQDKLAYNMYVAGSYLDSSLSPEEKTDLAYYLYRVAIVDPATDYAEQNMSVISHGCSAAGIDFERAMPEIIARNRRGGAA